MANELTVVASLAFAKGTVSSISRASGNLSVTVSGSAYAAIVQNVGTSEEQLDFGAATTPGYCLIKNLDATNYVEIRAATGVADLVKISPGKSCLFPFAADCTAPFAIANSSAVNIEMLLIEA